MLQLTHLDQQGAARMVDIADKAPSLREAVAVGRVLMQPATLQLIADGALKKGDVLSVARIAGIQAAKKCWDLIPLCHVLLLSSVEVDLQLDWPSSSVKIRARVRCAGQTGVEMEALTAVSVAALTLYDMTKAVDKGMQIGGIEVVQKRGGRSGDWQREEENSSC